MKTYNHIVDRNTLKWGSFGKSGKDPVKLTLIKDINDVHLENIISHLTDAISQRKLSNDSLLSLFIQEKKYREDKGIIIPEDYAEWREKQLNKIGILSD